MKKFNLVTLTFTLSLIFCGFVNAQNGPAGIGNSSGSGGQPVNIVWFDGSQVSQANGSNVLTLTDLSGTGNNATQTNGTLAPILRTGIQNGLNILEFSQSDNRIVVNPVANMAQGNITATVVYRSSDTNAGLLSYAVPGQNNEYLWFQTGGSVRTYIGGSDDNTGTNGATGNYVIATHTFSSATGATNFYLNGNQTRNQTGFQTGTSLVAGGSLAIAGEQDAVNGGYDAAQAFNGNVAEIILYRTNLSDAQRIVLENYLSAKWNVSLSSNDFYAGDTPANNNYDFFVSGIGQSGGSQLNSGVSGGLYLAPANGTLNANGEFLLMGRQNSTTNSVVTSNLGTGVAARWQRDWYLDKTGSLDAELTFDFSEGINGQYPQDVNGYVLLRRSGTTYSVVNIANAQKTISGDKLSFQVADAALTDGFYTLGTTNNTTHPLTGSPNRTWFSYADGNWDDPAVWTLDGSATPLYDNPANETPGDFDNVVITNGKSIIIPSSLNNLSAASLEVIGRLNVRASSGHNFGTIKGRGIIQMQGAGGVGNFPAGDATEFADAATGGTVEITSSGFDIVEDRIWNNLIVNASGATIRLKANVSLNGNLLVRRGTLQFGDAGYTTAHTLTVRGTSTVVGFGSFSGQISVGTGNARHQWDVYGNVINNQGTIRLTNRTAASYNNEATNGIVDINFLNNLTNQTLTCNGTSVFYRIEVDKGTDETYKLTIEADNAANFALYGYANENHASVAQLTSNSNALGLLRGTVVIGNNVTINQLNNSGNYNISEAAQLWVDGGSVTKSAGTAIVVYGIAKVSNGSLAANVGSGFTLRGNGTVDVSGGALYANQIRTSVLGVGNEGGYTQSGGVAYINGVGNNTDYYPFNLTFTGNAFNMSGGTLNVKRGTSGGGIFINSDPANVSVTGGTVILETDNNTNFKITSRAPFFNLILRNTSGSNTSFDVSSDNGVVPDVAELVAQPLVVKRDLIIESDAVLNHNGQSVTIARNFTIEEDATYQYSGGAPNTTFLSGNENATLNLQNITGGGSNNEQRFHNLVVSRSSGSTLTMVANSNKNVNNDNSNLVRIDGAFSLLEGTVDHGIYSIRFYGDVTNYGILGLYTPGVTPQNALLKFRPESFTIQTSEDAQFGNVRLNNTNNILSLSNNIYVKRIEYRHGRINLGTYRLTLDELDINLNGGETNGGILSVEDMFITSGKASDGGLRLYVPASATNGATFTFPLGIGSTNNAATSKYTPAQLTVYNVSDDGYIQLSLEDSQLLTTENGAGNILDYYWRVRYDGFSSLPSVKWDFTYNNRDTHTGNQLVAGDNYVSGKVLDNSPFTRSFEPGVISGTNTITFDNNGAAQGFTLENANYTAGVQARFVGAPQIWYNRNNNRQNWNNQAKWTLNSNGSDDGNTGFPEAGDIVYIRSFGQGNDDGWVNADRNINIAQLIFDGSAGGWSPRLWVTDRDAILNLGKVSGDGTIYFEITDTQQQTITGTDLGEFINNDDAVIILKEDNNSTNTIALIPNGLTEFPSLRIEGDNQAFDNRTIKTAAPITIYKNLWVDYGGTFAVAHDVTIRGDLRHGNGGGNRGKIYLASDRAVTFTVEDDFRYQDNGVELRFEVDNSTPSGLVHRVRVGGDIDLQSNDSNSLLDLFNGNAATDNNAELEFFGSGDVIFSRDREQLPDLYRIIINKDNGLEDSITVNTNFALNGPTNGLTKALELQAGMLRLNQADIDITLSSGTSSYSIPEGSGLEIAQGDIRLTGNNVGLLLDGTLRISGGNALFASGTANNFIEYSTTGTATLEVSGGVLQVGSQIRRGTSSTLGVLHYTQTGGSVTIGVTDAPEASRAMFEVLNSGTFIHTGGSFTILRQNGANPTVAALYLEPAISNTTGSVINLGNASTPAGQANFGIDAAIELGQLVLGGTNSPTYTLPVRPLTVSNSLTLSANATLDAQGRNVTIGENFVHNGTYLPGTNTTTFNGDANQSISGTGSGNFYNLTKAGSNTLSANKAFTIGNVFTIEGGVFADNGNTINLLGNMVHNGTHTSSGGNGIVFNGTSQQLLQRSAVGTSTFGILTISNPANVIVPDGTGFSFVIQDRLRLEEGVLDIGGNLLELTENSQIEAVNPFSATNMIQTNSSFTDNGVRKYFNPISSATTFVFPVGQGKYTPVTLNWNSSSAGSLTVRPANELHPSVLEDNEAPDLEIVDNQNALKYHWIITSNGLSNVSGSTVFGFDNADILLQGGTGYTVANYIPARLLASSTTWDKAYSQADFNEGSSQMTFNFAAAADAGISGDYTAGVGVNNSDVTINGAIPDEVPIYVTTATGGNFAAESSYASYTGSFPVGGPVGGILQVADGANLTLTSNGARLLRTEIGDGATLDVSTTTNHRLGTVTGTGTLKVNSSTMPAGYYVDFFTCTGGGLEYSGSTDYSVLAGIPQLRRVIFSGSGTRDLPNSNILICEDLEVDGPTVTNDFSREITVREDAIMTNGTFTVDNAGELLIGNNLVLNGGTLEGGTNAQITVGLNMVRTSGLFLAQGATVNFVASGTQAISGNFTGTNSFYRLNLNKTSGNLILATASTPLTITNRLSLQKGILQTNGNSLTLNASASINGGSAASYVWGGLTKLNLGANQTLLFPVGSQTRYMPAQIQEDATANADWTVSYSSSNDKADNALDTDNANGYGELESVSSIDKWTITGANGTNMRALIGLRYGSHNNVTDRNDIVVAHYNTANNEWVNKGASLSGGSTNAAGFINSLETTSFSTQEFSIGTTGAAPLPVEFGDLTAKSITDGVKLDWFTYTETNNNYFEVEHSTDGTTFNAVGLVEGMGNTATQTNYSFTHLNPAEGFNYYRLKQVDYDGQFAYSQTVRAIYSYGSLGKSVVLYPNPVPSNRQLNLQISGHQGSAKGLVMVTTTNGKNVYANSFTTDTQGSYLQGITLPAYLPAGLYLVRVQVGKHLQTLKITIE
jgi:hypothetical protein